MTRARGKPKTENEVATHSVPRGRSSGKDWATRSDVCEVNTILSMGISAEGPNAEAPADATVPYYSAAIASCQISALQNKTDENAAPAQ